MHKDGARTFSNLLLGVSIAFIFVLVLSAVSVFADGEGGGGGGGSSSTSGGSSGGGGGPACIPHTVPIISTNPYADVTSIEPWTPNYIAPKEGDRIGYKIFVKNYDKTHAIDMQLKVTAIASGFPYTWQSEVKSIGPGAIISFTNSFNIKFTNKTIPLIISFSYGDHESYGNIYCGSQLVGPTWLVFNEIHKNIPLQLGKITDVTPVEIEKTNKIGQPRAYNANATHVKVGFILTRVIVDVPFGSIKFVDIDKDGESDVKITVGNIENTWAGTSFSFNYELVNKTKSEATSELQIKPVSDSQVQNNSAETAQKGQISEENTTANISPKIESPTAAIILTKPEKKESGVLFAIKNFFARIFGGKK